MKPSGSETNALGPRPSALGPHARIALVEWWRVRAPFAAPFGTARGRLAVREGLVLALTDDAGRVGWGEASPWPLFGQGDAGDVARVVAGLTPRVVGLPPEGIFGLLEELDLAELGVPAARCGFDLAAHDLLGQARGMTVGEMFGAPQTAVTLNATIGAEEPEVAAALAHAALAEGYGCLKVKVAAGTLAADEARVAAVREACGPAARLRLDANGGWGVEEALVALGRLARYGLELVEQPVPGDDLAGLARVRRAGVTPIAADEAVRTLADARRIVEAGAADILVVKPGCVGGLRPGRAIIELAAAAGLEAIVTTTIDFGIGIAGALHLAAALPHPRRPCGLATARFLASDLTDGQPSIRGGQMALPPRPGLGVVPDPAALARYTTEPPGEVPA